MGDIFTWQAPLTPLFSRDAIARLTAYLREKHDTCHIAIDGEGEGRIGCVGVLPGDCQGPEVWAAYFLKGGYLFLAHRLGDRVSFHDAYLHHVRQTQSR